ncbi:hypothetical protein SAMD00019534_062600 [Acytostelium subglobosum LB1]|uniref:hypothetical protein n=1 Tax=Acytostelium subglobosum LB1 TaxID=1410327 RepID=UPI000644A3AA|nr:hypothetical protein SAMD00019534_062600 [Acytostelium subglobosum LB1]GAM23085.1 hypothetical protein SAMD00019534_062600 [Acytostelium subglobosum LB1]|eukprot:XP_012754312.1 hypothetical protein SAMD00019534_062600 [Acytostelium subglobosum LB1]
MLPVDNNNNNYDNTSSSPSSSSVDVRDGQWINKPYDISHWVLSTLYLALAIASIVQLIRTRKRAIYVARIFFLSMVFASLMRAFSFALLPFAMEDQVYLSPVENQILAILKILPSFLYFTVYSISLFFGLIISMQVYLPTKMKANTSVIMKAILIGNVFMYVTVIVLYLVELELQHAHRFVVNPTDSSAGLLLQLYASSIYFGASIILMSFLFHQYRSYYKEIQFAPKYEDMEYLKSKKNPYKKQTNKMAKLRLSLIIVFMYCTLSFLIRSVLVALTPFNPARFNAWYFDLLYYVLLELPQLCFLLEIMSRRTALIMISQAVHQQDFGSQEEDNANPINYGTIPHN